MSEESTKALLDAFVDEVARAGCTQAVWRGDHWDVINTRAERAEAELARPTSGWQPIETAPRDGTPMDQWTRKGNRRCGVEWVERLNGWSNVHTDDPATHWMPLPAPPA